MSKQKGNESNALTQDLESCFSPSEFKFTNLYCGAQPPPQRVPPGVPRLNVSGGGLLQLPRVYLNTVSLLSRCIYIPSQDGRGLDSSMQMLKVILMQYLQKAFCFQNLHKFLRHKILNTPCELFYFIQAVQ